MSQAKPIKLIAGEKLRSKEKLARIPIKIIPTKKEERAKKPSWMKVKSSNIFSPRVKEIKNILRKNKLHSVCEEANCPNLGECFNKGTATFMILGAICTRRCPFCDVAHGKPLAVSKKEAYDLAKTIADLELYYVVITSVNRDDLKDGGATHFKNCIKEIRAKSPNTKIEILTPDFRGRGDLALDILANNLPDIFNHNIETVPSLYKKVRPGAQYLWSLELLENVKKRFPHIGTKTGIMLGLGETKDELVKTFKDLRKYQVERLTLGQYLQPSLHHLPIERYIPPSEFKEYKDIALELGFLHVASGPLVRSSYHADIQDDNSKEVS